MTVLTRIFLCAVLSLIAAFSAHAHSGSTSYLRLAQEGDGLALSLSLELADIEYALGVDADGNGELTWGELVAARNSLEAYVLQRIHVQRRASECPLAFDDLKVETINGAPFAVLIGAAACPDPGSLAVKSNLLFDLDTGHRTLIEWSRSERSALAVLTSAQREWNGESEPSVLANLAEFALEGMTHIWSGFDHLAFLLVLLLPACLASHGTRQGFAWRKLILIISAFTVAHSITLALAVTKVVQPPERAIEIAIAASVTIAALTNLIPKTRAIGVATAFVFGLLHGFGFASALEGLGSTTSSFATALAGFNLGVEAGQLVVVAAAFPVLIFLRAYPSVALRFLRVSSVLVGFMGLVWVFERATA